MAGAVSKHLKYMYHTSHEGMYDLHLFGKLALRQNSECCNADFWPVRRLGLS